VSLNSHISVSSFVVMRNIKILNLYYYLEQIRRKHNSSKNDKLRGLRFSKGGSYDTGCVGRDALSMHEWLSWFGRSADDLNSE